ncbi:MAG: PD-(D/E)XK nuclease family protein [Thermoanaerobaculia bacterium]|jgi:CRISPR/Cas system-associated exonuclease Cas4 (RecB family)
MRPAHLSVSQVNLYLRCPRAYLFRYIERREPERASIDLVFGKAVHSAIGWWVEERLKGVVPEGTALARTFRADFTAESTIDKLDLDDKDPAELKTLGERLVGLAAHALSAVTPVASELRFEVELIDPISRRALPVPLLGFIDLVLEEDVIGEIKTAARKTSVGSYLLQLAAYRYAWRKTKNSIPRLQVIELLKTKEPDILVIEADVSDRDERWFAEVATAAYASITRDAFHPVPNYLCGRCEYRQACRKTA